MLGILKDAVSSILGKVWPKYRYVQLIDEIASLAIKCDVEDHHFDVMQKILVLSEDETHYTQLVHTMISHISESSHTGALSIGYLLDIMAIPSPETAISLTEKLYEKISCLEKSSINKVAAPVKHYKIRNIFIVIGMLAEKLAGRTAEQLFSAKLLELLLQILDDYSFPIDCRLNALLTLEKFSVTGSNKEKLSRSRFVSLLQKFEEWEVGKETAVLQKAVQNKAIAFPSYSSEHLQILDIKASIEEIKFVSTWLLDNSFAAIQDGPKRNFDHLELWKTTNAFMSRKHGTSYIKISPDGLTIRNDNTSFESIRANIPANRIGCWYYEVELITPGMMQIGWATERTNFESDDGQGVGDTFESFAYDGFRMQLWLNSEPISFGPKRQWKAYDILSSLINLKTGAICFAVNGEKFYEAPFYLSDFFLNTCLFPAASLTHHQQIRFNFGREPFKYAPKCLESLFNLNDQALNTIEPFPEYHRANLWPRQALVLNSGSAISSAESSCATSPNNSATNLPGLKSSSKNKHKRCMICFSAKANAKLEPCSHDGLCYSCALRVEICPLCRAPIETRQELQLPPKAPKKVGLYKKTGTLSSEKLTILPRQLADSLQYDSNTKTSQEPLNEAPSIDKKNSKNVNYHCILYPASDADQNLFSDNNLETRD